MLWSNSVRSPNTSRPVAPDEVKRAYLIDSIRPPAETDLFRRTYVNAFALIGVVCEEGERRTRVLDLALSVEQAAGWQIEQVA